MGIDFSVIFLMALLIELVIGLVLGTACLVLGIYLYRKISGRVRSRRERETLSEDQSGDIDTPLDGSMQAAA